MWQLGFGKLCPTSFLPPQLESCWLAFGPLCHLHESYAHSCWFESDARGPQLQVRIGRHWNHTFQEATRTDHPFHLLQLYRLLRISEQWFFDNEDPNENRNWFVLSSGTMLWSSQQRRSTFHFQSCVLQSCQGCKINLRQSYGHSRCSFWSGNSQTCSFGREGDRPTGFTQWVPSAWKTWQNTWRIFFFLTTNLGKESLHLHIRLS